MKQSFAAELTSIVQSVLVPAETAGQLEMNAAFWIVIGKARNAMSARSIARASEMLVGPLKIEVVKSHYLNDDGLQGTDTSVLASLVIDEAQSVAVGKLVGLPAVKVRNTKLLLNRTFDIAELTAYETVRHACLACALGFLFEEIEAQQTDGEITQFTARFGERYRERFTLFSGLVLDAVAADPDEYSGTFLINPA